MKFIQNAGDTKFPKTKGNLCYQVGIKKPEDNYLKKNSQNVCLG